MNYFRFIAANARLLTFGFMLSFFSGFGQTFFIGVFGAELRADFGLSHSGYGLIYSLATLANALCFVWAGRQIDRIDLRLYTAVTCGIYIVACLLIALMPALPALLFVGFTLVRLTGQGLMAHIAASTMARYFREGRGKAVSLATLGFPAAEALFPPLGVLLIGAIGWRNTWLAIGIVLAVVLVPLVLWLLRGQRERERRFLAEAEAVARERGERDWVLSEVLRDAHFYLVLPAVVFTPFVVTGLFFHQAHVAELKGWGLGLFASAFTAYAAASLVGALGIGPLIDRIGARRIVPLLLGPLGIALLLLAASDHPAIAFAFMLGSGLTTGAGLTLLGALWAEMYGPLHIGSIRSVVWTVMVFVSAVSPVLFGALFDNQVSVEAIAIACLGGAVAASLLAGPARGLVPRTAA